MPQLLYISSASGLFCITFGLMLLLTGLMSRQSSYFYTMDPIVRKFSIIDLELAASPTEIVNIVRGLYHLPDPSRSQKAIRHLKGQLYLDFLFMPMAYGSIFLLCEHVAAKLTTAAGQDFFLGLAWAQGIAWCCDIIENIYLLGKIRPDPVCSTAGLHSAYLKMEAVKWGISLIGAVSALAAACYFWLSGNYSGGSLYYLAAIVIEILVFAAVAKK